ncbi:MAG TPA: hypothetical protein VF159_03955 [Gemmatimonadaceae bacterium]
MIPSVRPATVAESGTGTKLGIAYRVGVSDLARHLYDVQIDVDGIRDDDLSLQMPVWSPGRYEPFFFARNVSELAMSSGSTALAPDRLNGSLWRVRLNGASHLTVRYRVYANSLSGTFSVIDSAHANWNGASLFMYVVGHKADPVSLHIDRPAGWHVVNGDTRRVDQSDFRFENYDRLVDTPTEVAPAFMLDSFVVDGRTYRTMLHHNGAVAPATRQRFVSDVERIVRYENTVFDPPPLQTYTFLFNLGFHGGDGMEHLYSTQIMSPTKLVDDAQVLAGISTAAHEYFHVWNMKRVRAAALGPFDYAHEVYQPSLWVGEGWTQYYGMMALPRSGVQPAQAIYDAAATLIRANLTTPGRREVSPRMASFLAPFWDGPTPVGMDVNRNAYFTYYASGAGRALYLDLFIREHTGNARSLDDAFRLLRDRTWNAPNASYYLQGRGYTEQDIERAVSDVAGVDMHQWFERCVGGTDDVNFDEVLAPAGVRLIRDTWTIEPIANPTPAQRKVRDGWVSGKTG